MSTDHLPAKGALALAGALIALVALVPVALDSLRALRREAGLRSQSERHLRAGESALAAQDYPRSVAALERALELDPASEVAALRLRTAQAHIIAEQPGAIDTPPAWRPTDNIDAKPSIAPAGAARLAYDLSCAQADGGERPEIFDVALGNIALAVGDQEGAARSYLAALARKPDLALAHVLLGALRLRQGRVDEAQASLQRAVEAEPRSARAQALLGEILSRQEKWAQAAEAFTRAAERAADFPTLVGLGRARLEQKRWADAYESYEQALKGAPPEADAAALHGALGIAAFNLGQFSRALDHLEQSLRIAPKLGTRFTLGIVHEAAGDLLLAARIFEDVVREDPTLGEAQVRLVAGRIKLGQLASAREAALRFAEVAAGRKALDDDLAAIRRMVAESLPPPTGGRGRQGNGERR